MAILSMQGIEKSFGGVRALKKVDLTLEKSEILGLVGENGAGKSTLMKILSGAIKEDAGSVFIEGKESGIKNPQDAISSGISVIYQELNMAKDLSVAENVFLGDYPRKNSLVDWKRMRLHTNKLLDKLAANFDANARISDLWLAQQQLVEIAKALKNNSKIIVFDEPSAVLGKSDSQILFSLIRQLKQDGISIIYISHRLDEVLELTDSIMVLRDGENVIRDSTSLFTMQSLVANMTGRDIKAMWPEIAATDETVETVLEVRNLRCDKNRLYDISFELKKGEVLGLAGLVGSGRSEIARCIFGIDKIDEGEVLLNSRPVKIRSPMDAIRNKIAFVMEDRKNLGLVLERPIFENITIAGLKVYATLNVVNGRKEARKVKELKDKLLIKTDDVRNPVKSLSGGNQQKVVLAKWLHNDPNILILDEPTRGVDVGAKAEIYRIIEELKQQGKAILLISSEFQEIMGLSTRVVVIKEGTIVSTFTRQEAMMDSRLWEALS